MEIDQKEVLGPKFRQSYWPLETTFPLCIWCAEFLFLFSTQGSLCSRHYELLCNLCNIEVLHMRCHRTHVTFLLQLFLWCPNLWQMKHLMGLRMCISIEIFRYANLIQLGNVGSPNVFKKVLVSMTWIFSSLHAFRSRDLMIPFFVIKGFVSGDSHWHIYCHFWPE